MSSRDQQQEVIFEEEEVLWAKIRGYPWWPAFVDKLHPNNRGGETQYTVFFFGDNTHSKLGSSKLRKFYENYPQFYQKAKSHKKLMISIQMAEEKLKQNDQNVEIFEQLRVGMKNKRKSYLSQVERKQSKISQPELQISPSKMQFQLPSQLNKSKTFTNRTKKSKFYDKQQQQDNNNDIKEERDDQLQQKQSIKKNTQNIGLIKQEKSNLSKFKFNKIKTGFAKKGRKPKIQAEEIFQQQPEQAEKKQIVVKLQKMQKMQGQSQKIEQEVKQQQIQQSPEEDCSQQIQDDEDLQKSSPEQRLIIKKYANLNYKRQIHQRQSSGPRKRGRPKKRILRNHSSEQKEKNNYKLQRNNRALLFKKKLITKIKHSPKKRQTISRPINPNDNKMIQEISNLLGNRMQLVDYLKNTRITTQNVKEILDLDVSDILQEGQLTAEIHEILQILKIALLFKYFPDDIKHKKRYEKIIKKRNIIKKEDAKQETSEKEVQCIEEENQIRKKTIVKLEKFLKYVPQNVAHAKQMAIKLESFFENKDKTIGKKYKSIAFQVLSNLKEKKETYDQVITKLNQNAYD